MYSFPILPGATLGILGGGQLGKMFCASAQSMGYRIWVLDPDSKCPAANIADRYICAKFDDITALELLATHCAAVTTEFENIPANSLFYLSTTLPVSPSAESVSITQYRWGEKSFLRQHNFPTTSFWKIQTIEELSNIPSDAFPGILKVSRFGYDGKGQIPVSNASELEYAWNNLEQVECILEKKLTLDLEISVMVARSHTHAAITWPVAENHHKDGILETSIVPARIHESLANQARDLALKIANTLNYIGILGVEFFVSNNKLYINELAPRPHNSGHYTIEASVTSQFEQQVRVLCGLPLGNTELLSPAVMLNILGDAWTPLSPNWEAILAKPGTKLHLYGKNEPRPKRKMGHITCLNSKIENAIEYIKDCCRYLSQEK